VSISRALSLSLSPTHPLCPLTDHRERLVNAQLALQYAQAKQQAEEAKVEKLESDRKDLARRARAPGRPALDSLPQPPHWKSLLPYPPGSVRRGYGNLSGFFLSTKVIIYL